MKRSSLVCLLLVTLVAAGWALSGRSAKAVPQGPAAAALDPEVDPALWRQCGPKHWRACMLRR